MLCPSRDIAVSIRSWRRYDVPRLPAARPGRHRADCFYSDDNGHSHIDNDAHADGYLQPHAHADGDEHRDEYADGDGNRYADPYRDTDFDAHLHTYRDRHI